MPVVLSREEVAAVLDRLRGVTWLIAVLLYGAGLRLSECLDLRVKDIDFDRRQIVVRDGKGAKDRPVPLPALAVEALVRQLDDVRRLHQRDLAAGYGRVMLPDALTRKYPSAAAEWRWQFVFPAARLCRDARWGPRKAGTTDFEKKKSYWPQIEATYREVGFDPAAVRRVWVCWVVKRRKDSKPIDLTFHSRHLARDFEIEVLSLRDFILPELQNTIGTANYDDEVLRTLGFVKQRELQSTVA